MCYVINTETMLAGSKAEKLLGGDMTKAQREAQRKADIEEHKFKLENPDLPSAIEDTMKQLAPVLSPRNTSTSSRTSSGGFFKSKTRSKKHVCIYFRYFFF